MGVDLKQDFISRMVEVESISLVQAETNKWVRNIGRATLESWIAEYIVADIRQARRIKTLGQERSASNSTESTIITPVVGNDNLVLSELDLAKRRDEFEKNDPEFFEAIYTTFDAYTRKSKRRTNAAYDSRIAQYESLMSADPVRAQHERQRDIQRVAEGYERINKIRSRMWDDLARTIEKFKDSVIVEWTTELLNSPISLPDGTETTWGEATIDQHLARQEMFQKNALANVEGAARHAYAAKQLAEANVPTLNTLVKDDNEARA